MKVGLHSNGDASRLTALLLPRILPIFSVVDALVVTSLRYSILVASPSLHHRSDGRLAILGATPTFTTGS